MPGIGVDEFAEFPAREEGREGVEVFDRALVRGAKRAFKAREGGKLRLNRGEKRRERVVPRRGDVRGGPLPLSRREVSVIKEESAVTHHEGRAFHRARIVLAVSEKVGRQLASVEDRTEYLVVQLLRVLVCHAFRFLSAHAAYRARSAPTSQSMNVSFPLPDLSAGSMEKCPRVPYSTYRESGQITERMRPVRCPCS